MIKFKKPTNLNGQELREELRNQGIFISDDKDSVIIDSNGDFFLDIDLKDKSKADFIVASHDGTIIAPDKTAVKAALLSRLGITEDEAKLLLS